MVENLADLPAKPRLDPAALAHVLQRRMPLYDRQQEAHYNLISALHKSMRGSDPDAALYWLARMLQGGEDPRYIARRLVRMASEDIGLADPWALPLALAASRAYEQLGSPEGELALAECAVHLACAPKSNAVYRAFGEAWRAAKESGSLMPPAHILNAPTRLMKDLGYGRGYAYDHDAPERFSGQNYFPEGMERPSLLPPDRRGRGGADPAEARGLGGAAARARRGDMSAVELRAVAAEEAELRLDRWFRRHFPGLSHGRLQKLLRTGQVRIDGRRADAAARLRAGPADPDPAARRGGRRRCAAARACGDRAGRRRAGCAAGSCTRTTRFSCSTSRPGSRCRAAPGPGGISTACWRRSPASGERPRLVHRLDRDTSGLLVVARTRARRGEPHRSVPPASGAQALLGAGGRPTGAGGRPDRPAFDQAARRARRAGRDQRGRAGGADPLSHRRPRRQGRELARAAAA